VESVGAFWQQARRARVPGARQAVVAVPVTFHLVGEIRSIAYAQLLTGPGLREAYEHDPQATLVWHLRSDKLAPLAFAEFALPVLGLFWTGLSDTAAQALGVRLLETLTREIPHPEWELEQQFGVSLERVFTHLAETEYLEAGATLRSTHE
ncbi:MAG: hypothetical protein ACRESU_07240, partial [Gammaproteobacteria bacterium]